MAKIFVQIAAYNDDELPKTVNDCMAKSSGQNEIYFGIHECYIDNKTIFELDNVKIKYSKAPQNLGVGMGRYIANQLYNGEDYYLQVDCHTRFRENWDIFIINDLTKELKLGNKCVLTGYPPGFWYDENDGHEVLDLTAPTTLIRLKRQGQKELFSNARIIDQEGKPSDGTFCQDSLSAGFVFGPGEIHKVKQHPGIFYFGEEFHRAATFYSHGYNLMAPATPVVYHLYGNHSKRIPCWYTYPKEADEGVKISDGIIKRNLSNYEYNDSEYKLWFGEERSLKLFENYLGIDFKNGIIHEEVKDVV